MYIVPTMASEATGTSKNIPYGAKSIDVAEKNQIDIKDRRLALIGMAPVSKNSLTCLPKRRFCTTKLYKRSEDLTNNVADSINHIVPGNPGKKYPNIPKAKNRSPKVIKSILLILDNRAVLDISGSPLLVWYYV